MSSRKEKPRNNARICIKEEFKEFLPGFVASAREHLDGIEQGLLRLEKSGPADGDAVTRISRNAHSLKGAAMTLGLEEMAEICHSLEDLIRGVHDGRISSEPPVFEALFQANDANRAILQTLNKASSGTLPDLRGILENMTALMPSENGTSESPRAKTDKFSRPFKPSSRPISQDSVRISTEKVDRFLNIAVELVITRNRMQSFLEHLSRIEEFRKKEKAELVLFAQELEKQKLNSAFTAPLQQLLAEAPDGETAFSDFSEGFHESLDALSRLVDETQQLVMDIRMLPVSLLFHPFSRSVRDLANEHHKPVELVIEGEETRIDKRAIEKLSDPLLHLLRNAIDHGLESPETRKAAQKPETGKIILRAFQDIDKVNIEVIDDGPGIERAQIQKKAVEKGFLSEEESKHLLDAEIFDLLFLPGFSTAEMVTELSGRGIGMDVVKNNVEKLNGSVEITSTPEKGTRIKIALPLTLATTRAFLVRCSNHILAIPVFSAIQALRLDPETIQSIKGREAVYWQGEIIPCARLDKTLSFSRIQPQKSEEKLSLLLLQHGGKKIAFQVDEILGVEEIVMRNLGTHLRRLPAFSGSSVLGTGEIALIIDVSRLFTAAQIKAGNIFLDRDSLKTPSDSRKRILLVEDQMTTRLLEKSILEAAGFFVEVAEDGTVALKKLESAPFDLVITDVQMPRMDGFTLTARLKKDERFSNIPVIVVTSLEGEEDRRQGLEAGADAFLLKKSFNQESLIQTISTLIGGRDPSEALNGS
jgi:two-component system chemotaxis sensor kinase CheA